jgi:hypothetical protein
MVLLLEWSSGRIEKPEGKRGTNEESSPFITMLKSFRMIGE